MEAARRLAGPIRGSGKSHGLREGRPQRPPVRGQGRALLTWTAVLLCAEVGVLGASAEELLRGHSIKGPPDIYQLAANWYLFGTAIPSRRSLVMCPGAASRMGQLWSRNPLLTGNFEVTMTLTASGSPGGSLAMWYVYENATDAVYNLSVQHAQDQDQLIANTWGHAFAYNGFDLVAYREAYDGLGVFLTDGAQPSVSALANDKTKARKMEVDLPTSDAVKVTSFQTGTEMVVKIRIQPQGAKVEVVGKGSIDVNSAFRSGGYLGFTCHGGVNTSSFWELAKLDVMNFDNQVKGEEIIEAAPSTSASPDEKVDVLRETSAFKAHRDENAAIRELTTVVFKTIIETMPVRLAMSKAVESLDKRITTMEHSWNEFKESANHILQTNAQADFDAIKTELSSLSSVASKETQDRHKRLESLHTDIADAHKTAKSTESIDKHLDKQRDSNVLLIDTLNNEHQNMFGVSIAAIAFILVAGLALYNKFRCWEHKHVL
mmetsp:Transcript_25924/g.54766  ORF Transcript_25924/g.54766 Transcript_25924/m.54766 type:complete len:490 (-) Transcript_25924:89-1558(-)